MALPLPSLAYALGAEQVVGGQRGVSDVIAAIKAAFDVATYWRTVSEPVVGQVLEVAPKVGSAAPNQRVLLTAATSNPPSGPTMWIDTWAASNLHVGLSPDGGTLGNWYDAQPHGTRFSGYARFAPDLSGGTIYYVSLYESDETFALVLRTNTNTYYACIVGAILEGFAQADVEADDRLYGMITGGTYVVPQDFHSATGASNIFGRHNTNNNYPHAGYFQPGQSSLTAITRIDAPNSALIPGNLTTPSGARVALPMPYKMHASPDYCVGMLRGIFMVEDGQYRTKVQANDQDRYLVFGASNTANVDALGFRI